VEQATGRLRILALEQMRALPCATQLLGRRRSHLSAQQPVHALGRHRPRAAGRARPGLRLAPRFDVVAENLHAGAIERLGVGHDGEREACDALSDDELTALRADGMIGP
jgi:hypothetical protein